MNNPYIEKIKLDYGYEKLIKDNFLAESKRTIRYNKLF